MQQDKSIKEIEQLGIEKMLSGELVEAAKLLRQAIYEGSRNFSSRLLLSRIMSELDRQSSNPSNTP